MQVPRVAAHHEMESTMTYQLPLAELRKVFAETTPLYRAAEKIDRLAGNDDGALVGKEIATASKYRHMPAELRAQTAKLSRLVGPDDSVTIIPGRRDDYVVDGGQNQRAAVGESNVEFKAREVLTRVTYSTLASIDIGSIANPDVKALAQKLAGTGTSLSHKAAFSSDPFLRDQFSADVFRHLAGLFRRKTVTNPPERLEKAVVSHPKLELRAVLDNRRQTLTLAGRVPPGAIVAVGMAHGGPRRVQLQKPTDGKFAVRWPLHYALSGQSQNLLVRVLDANNIDVLAERYVVLRVESHAGGGLQYARGTEWREPRF